MKRICAALLALFVLMTYAAAFAEDADTAAENLDHVSDAAGILSPEQIAEIEEKLDKAYADYGIDLVVATTNDSEGKSSDLYAADFYDAFRDYDAYPDGAALVFMFDIGKYYEVSRGKAEAMFGDKGPDALYEILRDGLLKGDYPAALIAWVDAAVETVAYDATINNAEISTSCIMGVL